ncbi:uncharacterized protein LOC135395607 [Ornithodoros turicata]|uniref:uncharacterized protein LOC135395607 n=1 Tax=Ornithodoros turicata TaxID=34597 RepID=UPI0031392BF0
MGDDESSASCTFLAWQFLLSSAETWTIQQKLVLNLPNGGYVYHGSSGFFRFAAALEHCTAQEAVAASVETSGLPTVLGSFHGPEEQRRQLEQVLWQFDGIFTEKPDATSSAVSTKASDMGYLGFPRFLWPSGLSLPPSRRLGSCSPSSGPAFADSSSTALHHHLDGDGKWPTHLLGFTFPLAKPALTTQRRRPLQDTNPVQRSDAVGAPPVGPPATSNAGRETAVMSTLPGCETSQKHAPPRLPPRSSHRSGAYCHRCRRRPSDAQTTGIGSPHRVQNHEDQSTQSCFQRRLRRTESCAPSFRGRYPRRFRRPDGLLRRGSCGVVPQRKTGWQHRWEPVVIRGRFRSGYSIKCGAGGKDGGWWHDCRLDR